MVKREATVLGREKNWNYKNWEGEGLGTREKASMEERMEIIWGRKLVDNLFVEKCFCHEIGYCIH